MYTHLIYCLLLIYVICCDATKSSKSSIQSKQIDRVIPLTDSNFFDHVLNSTQAWMVMFYAPWCGHCRALEPEWSDAARTNGEYISYGKVDCTTQTKIAGQFKISAYPTLYVFPAGKKSPKTMTKYKGSPKSRAISTHASTLLSSKLISRPYDLATITKFIQKRTPTHTKVIVFATQRDALEIWQGLSQHVSSMADVAYIAKGNDKLATLFSIHRYPTIILLRPPSLITTSPSYPGIIYHGDLSLTSIKHVITSYHMSSHVDGDDDDMKNLYPYDKDQMFWIDKKKHKLKGKKQEETDVDDDVETVIEPVATEPEPELEPFTITEPETTSQQSVYETISNPLPENIHDINTSNEYQTYCLDVTGICMVMIINDDIIGDEITTHVAGHYKIHNVKNSDNDKEQVHVVRIRVSQHGWEPIATYASSYDPSISIDRSIPISVIALIPHASRYVEYSGDAAVAPVISFVDDVLNGVSLIHMSDGLPSFQPDSSSTSTGSTHDDGELCGLEPTPACATDHDEL